MQKGMLDVERLLEGLNSPQRRAVTATEGPLLVFAGAGSGKTRVITYRIAYLIALGVDPERILGLTFTNKAAQEMKERVKHLLGEGWEGAPFLSTFHSFGLWVMRRFAARLDYTLRFNVYDDADQLALIKEILKGLGIDEREYPPRALRAAISRAKISYITPGEMALSTSGGEVLREVFKEYENHLKAHDAMDFDDLLLNPLRLLREDEVVRDFLQRRFSHIMVDEYQDTNSPQYEMVKLMALKHRNLCVVGDDDQSIYSWRGADVRNTLLFEADFPETEIVKLEENYRSTQCILSAAWHVIRENRLRKEKRLWTRNPRGEKIRLYLAGDEKDEARFVAEEIRELSRNRPLSDFAIFYRTNAQSRPFEEALMTRGIPYQVIGSLRFYDRREVKDIIAYLRLVENPNDVLAFRRVVNVPRRGIGEKSLKRVLGFVERGGLPLWDGVMHALEAGVLPSVVKARLLSFVEMMENLRSRREEMLTSQFIRYALEKTGYMAALEAEGTLEAKGRMENLRELVNVAVDYDRKEGGLREFIDRASLSTSHEEAKDGEMVTLMTLHSAKGLEFPVVSMVGMEEGFLPHYLSLDSQEELEEERRLCYVGITRAKELLFLTHAVKRLYYGRERSFLPSPFLKSIPGELLVKEGLYKKVSPEGGQGISASKRLKVGERVRHPIFGYGDVMALEGSGEGLKVRVKFDRVGIKLLLVRLARLKRMQIIGGTVGEDKQGGGTSCGPLGSAGV